MAFSTVYSISARFQRYSQFRGGENVVENCVALTGSSPRFPAQGRIVGDNKTPSILYYDRHGAMRVIGAEALQQQIIEQAEKGIRVKLER